MELTLWTYEGPPHVGAIRIAASMRDVHLVLHAPQGDTYADLLFTMIERDGKRPPVTYTTFQARDLGASTAEKFLNTLQAAYEHHQPKLILVADSCTAELIQDQPGTLAQTAGLPVPVVPLEMAAYSRKENWGASETFYHLVRALLSNHPNTSLQAGSQERGSRPPRVNLLGPTKLGFRCRDDVREITQLLESVGIDVNVVAPLGAGIDDLFRIPEADANVCLHPEIALTTCGWLERTFKQKTIKTVPLGYGATRDFLQELADVLDYPIDIDRVSQCRLPWYSRSVDSTYLTGKRVYVYGDGSHVVAMARVAQREMGFDVVGLGTYSREMAREVRAVAAELGVEALISDSHLAVEQAISELRPELVLGTQMERHIAKRLGIGCAVISTPAHVQDYPARYSPQMGFEGANVLFDTWVHPLIMGLEEHLLHMFRDDFEFNDNAVPSHLAHGDGTLKEVDAGDVAQGNQRSLLWEAGAENELKKIPFFVRGKAKRNTEQYALDRGLTAIDIETLYEAKAHYSR